MDGGYGEPLLYSCIRIALTARSIITMGCCLSSTWGVRRKLAGLEQFTVATMGLSNSPPFFQNKMKTFLSKYHRAWVRNVWRLLTRNLNNPVSCVSYLLCLPAFSCSVGYNPSSPASIQRPSYNIYALLQTLCALVETVELSCTHQLFSFHTLAS